MSFPVKAIWNPRVFSKLKSELLCMRSNLGKVLTLGSIEERRIINADGCFLCLVEEEKVDHIMLNYQMV